MAMFGWWSFPRARASRFKRATRWGSEANSCRRVLIATGRPRRRSIAPTTWLMPPSPSFSPSWKRVDDDSSVGRPGWVGRGSGFDGRSGFRLGIRLPSRSPKTSAARGSAARGTRLGAPSTGATDAARNRSARARRTQGFEGRVERFVVAHENQDVPRPKLVLGAGPEGVRTVPHDRDDERAGPSAQVEGCEGLADRRGARLQVEGVGGGPGDHLGNGGHELPGDVAAPEEAVSLAAERLLLDPHDVGRHVVAAKHPH